MPELGKWYLHLFDVSQADLNWENPAVREALKNVIRFWKGKGVQGFRFDVVNLISKPDRLENDPQGDGRRFYTDGPRVHAHIHELVRDTGLNDNITVGEMSSTTLAHCVRYSAPQSGELGMVFNFHHLKIDYKNGDKWQLQAPDLEQLRSLLSDWQTGMEQGGGWNAVFWCNHDQPRIVSRLGNDREYWKQSAKMLGTCIHLLRGTPYIYQGEELGMTNAYFDSIRQYRDVESLNYHDILLDSGLPEEQVMAILKARSRDNSRTPMQWDSTANAGFTAGTPWLGVPAYKPQANAADEQADPESILNYYRRLVRLRKEQPLIAEGDIRFVCPGQPGLVAYERRLADQKLLVLCNFTESSLSLPLEEGWEKAACLIDSYEQTPQITQNTVTLKPYEGCALMVK